jgi:hypothetical protein
MYTRYFGLLRKTAYALDHGIEEASLSVESREDPDPDHNNITGQQEIRNEWGSCKQIREVDHLPTQCIESLKNFCSTDRDHESTSRANRSYNPSLFATTTQPVSADASLFSLTHQKTSTSI